MAEEKNIPPVLEENKEPSSGRLIFTLSIAGFLSGIVLVGVFLFTKPLIAQNKQEALEEAIYKVLPGATSFETLVLTNGKLEKKGDAGEASKSGKEPEMVYMGYNDQKELIGFAIPASGPGFQDLIGTLFGYRPESERVIGFEVLESKETPGLGDKIYKDQAFTSSFSSLEVEPEIKAVDPGAKTGDNQVETITGATISSKAVIRIMNQALDKWQPLINSYVDSWDIKWAKNESNG